MSILNKSALQHLLTLIEVTGSEDRSFSPGKL